MNIFNSSGASYMPAVTGERAYSIIAFGDPPSTEAKFNMIDESVGSQASRLQVDATLDGKLHVTGTTTGTGAYAAVFYDGPIQTSGDCKADESSAMKKYLELKTLKERVATIYFYNSASVEDGGSVQSSSKPSAKFSGILNKMTVSLVEDNGLVYIRVGLNMLGSWESGEAQ
jgi:hypothetical protein